MNQFNILEDCLLSFYVPYFIVVDGVLCFKVSGIIIDFLLLGLKNSLKMKIAKEKVRILLLIIVVPLGNIGVDNVSLALISFQNMISKFIDDISKVFAFFFGKHNPIFHSRQKINILLLLFVINDCFISSIVNVVGKVNHLRLL